MRYRFFGLLIVLEILVLAFLVGTGYFSAASMKPVRRENQQLVRVFELTDFAIWTGARYTRHMSQADVFSAFQDSMGALEHFPEGALAPFPLRNQPATSAEHSGGRDDPAS